MRAYTAVCWIVPAGENCAIGMNEEGTCRWRNSGGRQEGWRKDPPALRQRSGH
jgi:hypothetical protein